MAIASANTDLTDASLGTIGTLSIAAAGATTLTLDGDDFAATTTFQSQDSAGADLIDLTPSSGTVDFTGKTVTNFDSLTVHYTGTVTLTLNASAAASFTTVTLDGATAASTLTTDETTLDLSGKTLTGVSKLTNTNASGTAITGSSGDESISGSSGADTLCGGRGADTLTGAGGSDVFLMSADENGTDIITDFTESDRLRISSHTLTSVGTSLATGGVQVGAFDGTYTTLSIDHDGNAATGAVTVKLAGEFQSAQLLSVGGDLVADTTAPVSPLDLDLATASDSGISDTDDATNDATPTISGTAEASSTVTLYDSNGTTVLGTTTANGGGAWSITASTLADGTHSLTAKATDVAGNTSVASAALTVYIDTTAPAALTSIDLLLDDTGTSSSDNITSDTTPTISGIPLNNSIVTLYDSDGTTELGTATAPGLSGWSITPSALADGTYSLTAKVSDFAGNTSAASPALSVTIDTTAPTLSASSPAAGAALADNVVLTFSETVAAGSGNVTLYKSDGTLIETFAAASLAYSGNTVTIDPAADLIFATGYYVQVAAGAITDLAGSGYAGIADTTTVAFTTAAAPLPGPSISGGVESFAIGGIGTVSGTTTTPVSVGLSGSTSGGVTAGLPAGTTVSSRGTAEPVDGAAATAFITAISAKCSSTPPPTPRRRRRCRPISAPWPPAMWSPPPPSPWAAMTASPRPSS